MAILLNLPVKIRPHLSSTAQTGYDFIAINNQRSGTKPMKRRDFILTSGLSGLGLALTAHNIFAQNPSTKLSCTQEKTKGLQPLLRFVALGDVGTGSQKQYAVAAAMNCYLQQNPFNLVLLAGDNIYNNGEIEKINSVFEQPYQPLLKQGVNFHAVLGNHDIRTNNGEDQIRYQKYNMPARFYTFNQNPVQFFALDTNKNSHWQEQLKWLEKNLSNSQATWKIVFGHHPLYSAGMHGGDPELVELLSPLFSRYKVQLYICGHDHNYERTKIIKGTTYIICGGGSNTRPVSKNNRTAFSAEKLSFAAFEVYKNLIKIIAIDSEGKVFDRSAIFAEK